jgi:hypothetical protein
MGGLVYNGMHVRARVAHVGQHKTGNRKVVGSNPPYWRKTETNVCLLSGHAH